MSDSVQLDEKNYLGGFFSNGHLKMDLGNSVIKREKKLS